MTQISTIRELFDAVGGPKAVAHAVGVKQPAVYMAMNRGSIPHRWRMKLLHEATARNLAFDPTLLGCESDTAA